jgi:hypothetical protein
MKGSKMTKTKYPPEENETKGKKKMAKNSTNQKISRGPTFEELVEKHPGAKDLRNEIPLVWKINRTKEGISFEVNDSISGTLPKGTRNVEYLKNGGSRLYYDEKLNAILHQVLYRYEGKYYEQGR